VQVSRQKRAEQVRHHTQPHPTATHPPTRLPPTHRARADEPLELRHQQGAVPGGNHCRAEQGMAGRAATRGANRNQHRCFGVCKWRKAAVLAITACPICPGADYTANGAALSAPPRTCAQAPAQEPLPRLLGRQLDEGGAPKEEPCRSRQGAPSSQEDNWRQEQDVHLHIRSCNTACHQHTTPPTATSDPPTHPPAR
jgi:hypothetical protein